jgi:hypothetical protein
MPIGERAFVVFVHNQLVSCDVVKKGYLKHRLRLRFREFTVEEDLAVRLDHFSISDIADCLAVRNQVRGMFMRLIKLIETDTAEEKYEY